MQKELFDKWLIALRSGKYQQGSGLLRNSDCEYCCLGVLADVMDADGWTVRDEWADSPYAWHREDPWKDEGTAGAGYVTALPDTTLDSVVQNRLIALNDMHKLSFNEIAGRLEEVAVIKLDDGDVDFSALRKRVHKSR